MKYSLRKLLLILVCFFNMALDAVGPIVPGESLWCITKRIGSSIDDIQSIIEELPFGATEIDINISVIQDIQPILLAISQSQAILCSKIEELSLIAELMPVL